MAYSYDRSASSRTAREYGHLATSYRTLIEEIKKASEHNGKLRVAMRNFLKEASAWEQPRWDPEEGPEEPPPESDPSFIKLVEALSRSLEAYERSLHDVEHHEPPH